MFSFPLVEGMKLPGEREVAHAGRRAARLPKLLPAPLTSAQAIRSRDCSTPPPKTLPARAVRHADTIRPRFSDPPPADAGARAPNRSPACLRVAGRIDAPCPNRRAVPTIALARQARRRLAAVPPTRCFGMHRSWSWLVESSYPRVAFDIRHHSTLRSPGCSPTPPRRSPRPRPPSTSRCPSG